MSWVQLRLGATRAHAETLEHALLQVGALSVTLEDAGDEPLLEPGVGETPLWQALRITGLFRADVDMDTIRQELAAAVSQAGGAIDLSAARVEILEDKDWEREWMQHYRPMRFGERLWICPSWLEPPDPTAVNLLLDPGLAFGTGTHPTTALCLEALDALAQSQQTVVDYGCGSGILAIAAARLGAGSILAVDNDPQALRATRDNAERNLLAESAVEVKLPGDYDRATWRGQANIVVANILAGPLAALADELCDLLAPGGTLLLAGLLDTQMLALIDVYAPRIQLAERARQDEWVCLMGVAR